jgi:FMN phosphatase YigB (HAD superfamily)
MVDSLKINSVTARQIPAISFSLREVLIHSNPSLKTWLKDFLRQREGLAEEDFEKLWFSWRAQQNAQAVAGALQGDNRADSLKSFLLESFPDRIQEFEDLYRSSIKLVFPQYVENVLIALRERGYRLTCVTNEPEAALEYLKMFRLLDFFEALILAKEEGRAKPKGSAFELVLDEMQIQSDQLIHVGSQFSTDVCAARSANIACLLYDPFGEERRAMDGVEPTISKKVVSIDEARQSRWGEGLRIIEKFDELLAIFR